MITALIQEVGEWNKMIAAGYGVIRDAGYVVGSLSPWDVAAGSWRDLAIESRCASPADVAILRLDFADWLQFWPRRHRQIIGALAAGYHAKEVPERFGFSLGRLSRLRRKYERSWVRFQNPPAKRAAA